MLSKKRETFASWEESTEGQAKIQRKQILNKRSKKASYSSKNSQLVSHFVPFKTVKKNHIHKKKNKTKPKNSSSSILHTLNVYSNNFWIINHNTQRGFISYINNTPRESNGILKKPSPIPSRSLDLLGRNSFVSTIGKRNVVAERLSQVQLRLIPSEWSETWRTRSLEQSTKAARAKGLKGKGFHN